MIYTTLGNKTIINATIFGTTQGGDDFSGTCSASTGT
jgi:hypothetical protein